MMNRLALVLVAVMLAGASAMTAQPAAQADKLLAAAQHKATVEGDLKGAIELYRQIAARAGANRSLAAQALLAMAECHEKLGQRDAAVVYERIVREFADQGESVSLARTRLSALQAGPRGAAGQTVRQAWSGAGVDPMGTPSADGRYLSFTDWETGDLAVRDLSANTSRRLTNTGGWQASGDFAEYSVLSPDGRQVAYAWFTDKGSEPNAPRCICRYELRLVSMSGDGKPRVLLSTALNEWVRPAAFTPDGKQLVVIRASSGRNFQLAVIALADASVRVVKSLGQRDPSNVSMSPDGRWVVYDAPGSPSTAAYDIVLLSLDGTRETRIVQSPAHDRSPVWSADGAHVLFISNRTGSDALWRLAMQGDKPAGPPVLVVAAAISGNSGLLGTARNGGVYYWTGGQNSNIYFSNLDERGKAIGAPKIAVEQFLNSNWAPSWSPDGARVAYLSRRGSSSSSGNVLMIHTVATGESREVPIRIVPADRVSWFPDGQSVLVASREPAENRFAFFRVELGTGEAVLVHRTKGLGLPNRRPELTRDGRALVYVDRAEANLGSGGSQLLRFDLASGQETELKRLDGNDDYFTSLAVSPDGKEVGYSRYEGDGRGLVLEVISMGGGPSRTLFRDVNFTGSRYSGLGWTPDQRHVLFARASGTAAPTTFWRVPVDGGAAEETGVSSPSMIRFPSVDPRGGRLMFEGTGGGAEPAIWVVENFLPRAPR